MEKLFLDILQDNNLFANLAPAQIEKLKPLLRILNFKENETIIHEGAKPTDLYVLVEGEVTVLKQDAETGHQHKISTLHTGQVFGELALIDNTPRSASIRTTKPTTVLAIAISDLQALADHSMVEIPIYYQIIVNLARELANRLRHSNESVVRSLTQQLELERKRTLIGRLVINLIIAISFYTFALNVISHLAHALTSSTIIGAPIITALTCATYFFIRTNELPISYYGLNLHNWRHALLQSFLYTIPILIIITAAKYIAIKTIPAFANMQLFEFTTAVNPNAAAGPQSPWMALLPLLYLLFVPLQELVFRGVLQGPLEDFLTGRHRVWLAILVSNFIFSMTHLHVSIYLSMVVFAPGIFWGWLYSRQRTLVGVVVSHLMVGGWSFFILGIKAITTHI